VKALERYLNSFGKSIVNKSIGILKRKKKEVTGSLINSINYKLIKTAEGYIVQFSMLDYGKFMDKGVSGAGGEIKTGKNKGQYTGIRSFTDYKGVTKKSPYSYKTKMPPTNVFDKWIVKKGIAPRDEKGRFVTRKSLKFAIAKSIYIKGIEGISFFQKPLGLELKGFSTEVAKAVKQDILNNINKR
tara:strand:- start:128 stop:685 length:558 start_codon:yes stop_codon:yes gene_type:complete